MRQQVDKVNRLKQLLPPGQIVTRKWLKEQGFNEHTLDNYVKSHRLNLLSKGVYSRSEGTLLWQNLVSSLPQLLAKPVVVGGLTALEFQGFAQYVQLGNHQNVHLYSAKSCPAWLEGLFKQLNEVTVHWHSTNRLWERGWPSNTLIKDWAWREGSAVLPVSAPEQAILELLLCVPSQVSLEHADTIMQGLTQLSPIKVAELLLNCRSIKVKRLFFWLADRHQYSWRKRLNAQDYELGSGKRVIQKNGELDTHYWITIPKEMNNE